MNRFEAMSAVAMSYADEICNLRAENARYRAALEEICAGEAFGCDDEWCLWCQQPFGQPHIESCPYAIAQRAVKGER